MASEKVAGAEEVLRTETGLPSAVTVKAPAGGFSEESVSRSSLKNSNIWLPSPWTMGGWVADSSGAVRSTVTAESLTTYGTPASPVVKVLASLPAVSWTAFVSSPPVGSV